MLEWSSFTCREMLSSSIYLKNKFRDILLLSPSWVCLHMPAASMKALLAITNTDVSNLSGILRDLFLCGINLSLFHGGTRVPKGLRIGSWTTAFPPSCKIAWGPPLQPLLLGACWRTARSKLQQDCSLFAGPTGAQHQRHEPKEVISSGVGAWALQQSSPAAVIPMALGLKAVFFYAGRSAITQPEETFPIQEYIGA